MTTSNPLRQWEINRLSHPECPLKTWKEAILGSKLTLDEIIKLALKLKSYSAIGLIIDMCPINSTNIKRLARMADYSTVVVRRIVDNDLLPLPDLVKMAMQLDPHAGLGVYLALARRPGITAKQTVDIGKKIEDIQLSGNCPNWERIILDTPLVSNDLLPLVKAYGNADVWLEKLQRDQQHRKWKKLWPADTMIKAAKILNDVEFWTYVKDYGELTDAELARLNREWR